MSPQEISFWVPGIPKPAGSKRGFVNRKTGGVIITDACKKTKPWQADVKAFAYEAMGGGPLLTCPLHVIAAFYMPRPKGHRNSKGMIKGSAQPYPTSRPDLLKVARAIEDAMSGVIYCDDSQIVIEHLTKKYEEHRGPGVEIKVGKIVE